MKSTDVATLETASFSGCVIASTIVAGSGIRKIMKNSGNAAAAQLLRAAHQQHQPRQHEERRQRLRAQDALRAAEHVQQQRRARSAASPARAAARLAAVVVDAIPCAPDQPEADRQDDRALALLLGRPDVADEVRDASARRAPAGPARRSTTGSCAARSVCWTALIGQLTARS